MTTLDTLDAELSSPGPHLISAAWDTLSLAADLANALAWEDGVHTESALAAAYAATQARDLLPLPQDGSQPALPDPVTSAHVVQLAEMLTRLQPLLAQAADQATEPDRAGQLRECVAATDSAATCLTNMVAPA